jgi:hypothetical protein
MGCRKRNSCRNPILKDGDGAFAVSDRKAKTYHSKFRAGLPVPCMNKSIRVPLGRVHDAGRQYHLAGGN